MIILQIWGGLFYLLNKIFLAFSEYSKSQQRQKSWRIKSWLVYIIGLPAWVWIFVIEHNWIAASVESSGLPAMILGLVLTIKQVNKETKQLKLTTKILDVFSVLAIISGIYISLNDLGGLHKLTQFLELGMVSGFLIGTYLLAKKRSQGYLFFMLMNSSNIWLMLEESYPILALQQVVSLGFVIFAYISTKTKKSI